MVFTIWAFVAAFVFPQRLLNADSDLLRHIRHGEYMLQQHGLLHTDPFSFTRGGEPFVAFEYGSQLILALINQAGGLAGNMLFAAVVIAATYAILTRFLLARGTDPLLTYLVSVAAAVLGAIHWLPRPHLFTLLFVTLLLHLLESERRWPVWIFAPLFALWANLHGGFVYGLVLLGIYLAGCLAEALAGPARGEWLARARYYGLGMLVGGVATLVNPNGIELHRHIVRHLSDAYVLYNTQEFWSPDFHETTGKMFLVALSGVIALLALSTRRLNYPRLFLVLAHIVFALQSRRNIPLFGVTVLPILALHFDAAWRRLPDRRGVRAVFERDARRGTSWPLVTAACAAFLVLGALRGRVAGYQLVPGDMNPQDYPVDAVRWAKGQNLQGRIFHEMIWGGYLLYAWPEQKVFIDGGMDFYGPPVVRDYLETTRLSPGWRETLAKWDITLVLLPPTASLTQELAYGGGWRVRYCDRTAAWLEQTQELAGGGPDAVAELERCAGP
ncbi:MAG TPA: hypothetical protein VFT84_07090 [Gemmatimonadales bacterium]|nr:hypothetical protein [Gemmatimonadales bacterium]